MTMLEYGMLLRGSMISLENSDSNSLVSRLPRKLLSNDG